VRTEMLETSFRIHRDKVTRTLITCPPMAERPKIGFDRQRRNGIFHVGNVILTALT